MAENLEFRAIFDGSQPAETMSQLQQLFKDMVSSWIADAAKAQQGIEDLSTVESGLIQKIREASASEAEFKENIVAVFNSLKDAATSTAALGTNFENLGSYFTSAVGSVVELGTAVSTTSSQLGRGALSAAEYGQAVAKLKGEAAELASTFNASRGVTAEQSAMLERETQLANISSEALARLATANKEVAETQASRKGRQEVVTQSTASGANNDDQITAHRALAAAYREEEAALRERNAAKGAISQQAGTEDNELVKAQAKSDALEATYAGKSLAVENAAVTQLKANQALAEGTISEQYYSEKVLAANNAIESRTKTLNKWIDSQTKLKELTKTVDAPASLPVVEQLTAPTALRDGIVETIPKVQTLDEYLQKVKKTLFDLNAQARPINADEYFKEVQKPSTSVSGPSEYQLTQMKQVPQEQLQATMGGLGREAASVGDENKSVILSQVSQAIKSIGLSEADATVASRAFFQGIREGAAEAGAQVKTLQQTLDQFKEVPAPSSVLPPRPPTPPAPPAGGGGGNDDDEARKEAALRKLAQAQINAAEATQRRQAVEKEWGSIPDNQLTNQVTKIEEVRAAYAAEQAELRRLQTALSEVRVTEAQQTSALSNEEETLTRLEGMYAAYGEKRMAAEKQFVQAKIDDEPKTVLNKADEKVSANLQEQEDLLERIKVVKQDIAALKTTGDYPQRTLSPEDVQSQAGPKTQTRGEAFAQELRSQAAETAEQQLIVQRETQKQIELENKLATAIRSRIELVGAANERYGDVTAASSTAQSKILAASEAQIQAEQRLVEQKTATAAAQQKLNDLILAGRNIEGSTTANQITKQAVKVEPDDSDLAAASAKVEQLKREQDVASRTAGQTTKDAEFFRGGPESKAGAEAFEAEAAAKQNLTEVSNKLASAVREEANVRSAVIESQARQASVSAENLAQANQEVSAIRNKIGAYTDLDRAQIKVLESEKAASAANAEMMRSAGGGGTPRTSGRQGVDFSKQEDASDAYIRQKTALQELIAVKEKDGAQYKITSDQVEALKGAIVDLDAAFAKASANTAAAASNVAYLERAYKDGAISAEQLAKVENAQQSAAENTIAIIQKQIAVLRQLRDAMSEQVTPKDVTTTLESSDAAIQQIVASTQKAVETTEALRSKITEVQGKFVNLASAAQVFKVTLGEGTGDVISTKLTSQMNDLNNATLTTKLRQDELNDKFRALEKEAERLGLTVKQTGQSFEILKVAQQEEEKEAGKQAEQFGYLGGRMGAMILGMNQLGFVFGIMGRQVQFLNTLLSELFPLLSIGFAADIIQNVVDKFTKAQDEVRKTAVGFTDLAASALEAAQGIEIQNLKLQDTITKLEGGTPSNQLAEAILEVRKESEQLTKALGDSLEKAIELTEKADLGVLHAGMKEIFGHEEAPSSLFFGLVDKFQDVTDSLGLASAATNRWRAAEAQLDLAIQQKNQSAITSAQKAVDAAKAAMQEAVDAASSVSGKQVQIVESQVRQKAKDIVEQSPYKLDQSGDPTQEHSISQTQALAEARQIYAQQLALVYGIDTASKAHVLTLEQIDEKLKNQVSAAQKTFAAEQYKETEQDIEPQIKNDEKVNAARASSQKEFANLDKQSNEDLIKHRVQAATEGGEKAAKAEQEGNRARIAVEEAYLAEMYAIEDEAYSKQRSILEFKKQRAQDDPDKSTGLRKAAEAQNEIDALDEKHNNEVIALTQTSANKVADIEADTNKRKSEEQKKALDKQLEAFRENAKREEEELKSNQEKEIQASTAYADDKKRAVDDEERFNLITHKQALSERLAILAEEQASIDSAMAARKAGLESLAQQIQKQIDLTRQQQGADASELKQLETQLQGVHKQYEDINKALDEQAVKFDKLKFDEQLKEWQRMQSVTSGFVNSTTSGFEQLAEGALTSNKGIAAAFAQMIAGVERNFIRMIFSVLEQTKLFRGISRALTKELDKVFHVKQPVPPPPRPPVETPQEAAKRVPQLPSVTPEKPPGYVDQPDLKLSTQDNTAALKELTEELKSFKPVGLTHPEQPSIGQPGQPGQPGSSATAYSPALPAPQLEGSIWALYGSNEKLADAITKYEAGGPATRNNNPGNLVYAGQPGATPASDQAGAFAQFPTQDAGRQALINQLNSTQRRHPDLPPEEFTGGGSGYAGYSPDAGKGNGPGVAENYAAYLRKQAGAPPSSESPIAPPPPPGPPPPLGLQQQPSFETLANEVQRILDSTKAAQSQQPQSPGTSVTTTTTVTTAPSGTTAPGGGGGGTTPGLPVYQEGGYVPDTGPAVLHQGEWVLTADQTRQALSATGTSGSGGSAGQQVLVNLRMEYQPEGSRGGGEAGPASTSSAPSSGSTPVTLQAGSTPIPVQQGAGPLQVSIVPSSPIPVSITGQGTPLPVQQSGNPFEVGIIPSAPIPVTVTGQPITSGAGAGGAGAQGAQGPSALGVYGAATPLYTDFVPQAKPLFGFIGQLMNLTNTLDKSLLKPLSKPLVGAVQTTATSAAAPAAQAAVNPAAQQAFNAQLGASSSALTTHAAVTQMSTAGTTTNNTATALNTSQTSLNATLTGVNTGSTVASTGATAVHTGGTVVNTGAFATNTAAVAANTGAQHAHTASIFTNIAALFHHAAAILISTAVHIGHAAAVVGSTIAHIVHAIWVGISSLAHISHIGAVFADTASLIVHTAHLIADEIALIIHALIALFTAGHAEGGLIQGAGTGTSDSIPTRVSHGEFIVRSAMVAQPGMLDILHGINQGRVDSRHVKGYSAGGFIQGEGTGTSDSNLAWLSHGEFVVQAERVSQAGMTAILSQINKGTLRPEHFAGRGMSDAATQANSKTGNQGSGEKSATRGISALNDLASQTNLAIGSGNYGRIGKAEKGGLLSEDGPIFAHANEMILPANISDGLQNLLTTKKEDTTEGSLIASAATDKAATRSVSDLSVAATSANLTSAKGGIPQLTSEAIPETLVAHTQNTMTRVKQTIGDASGRSAKAIQASMQDGLFTPSSPLVSGITPYTKLSSAVTSSSSALKADTTNKFDQPQHTYVQPEIHYHQGDIQALDGQGVGDVLARNHKAMSRIIEGAVRRGAVNPRDFLKRI